MLATTIHESNTTHPTTKDGATTTHPRRGDGLVVSKPNSVSDGQSLPSRPEDQPLNPGKRLLCTRTDTHYRAGPSNESLSSPKVPQAWAGHESRGAP